MLIFFGVAGIINIACMISWFGIYTSKCMGKATDTAGNMIVISIDTDPKSVQRR